MKLLALIIFSLLFIKTPVFAHNDNMPFIKINYKELGPYPAEQSSVPSIIIPSDVGSENYFVDYRVTFSVDPYRLGIPEEEIPYTTFYWEFGDGNQAEGTNYKHIYTTPGTYLVNLYKQSYSQEKELLHTAFVNVLPDPSYKLPEVDIIVNGKTQKNLKQNIIAINPKNEVKFKAKQTAGTGKVLTYQWDFGDGFEAKGEEAGHKYNTQSKRVQTILRVTDEQGIIIDMPLVLQFHEPKIGSGLILKAVAFTVPALTIVMLSGAWLYKRRSKKG